MERAIRIMDMMFVRHPELEHLREGIQKTFEVLHDTFASGGKLLICGNGGSSADADHIVGELMKEFKKKRPLQESIRQSILDRFGMEGAYLVENLQGGLPALSLTTHTAFLTAFSNDSKPDFIFAQQVHTLGRAGDCLLALSTSGNSSNVVYATMVAKSIGLTVIGMTGRGGGRIKSFCDVLVTVPEEETERVQEQHQTIYHTLCAMLEESFW
ncbi:MAG: SIS domain-containing protein [Spirochaetes bacterium]|nr:SIS domain-containing protein [Spirochaetota bacterium]